MIESLGGYVLTELILLVVISLSFILYIISSLSSPPSPKVVVKPESKFIVPTYTRIVMSLGTRIKKIGIFLTKYASDIQQAHREAYQLSRIKFRENAIILDIKMIMKNQELTTEEKMQKIEESMKRKLDKPA